MHVFVQNMGNEVRDMLLTVAANHANCMIIFLELEKTFHLQLKDILITNCFFNLYLGAGTHLKFCHDFPAI